MKRDRDGVTEVIEYIFTQYQEVLEEIIDNENWFPNEIYQNIQRAWNDLKIKDTKSSVIEGLTREKLIECGLSGTQWEFKESLIEFLREKFKEKTKKIALLLLKAINAVLGSLLSVTPIPGLDAMKEFKDFVEIAIETKRAL